MHIVRDVKDTANWVKSMKLGIVVSFKILIRHFAVATILGHVIDDVNSLYERIFLPAKQVILYTVGKQILCWLIFAEEPYPENQYFLSYIHSNIRWRHNSVDELGKFQKIWCDIYRWKYNLNLISFYYRLCLLNYKYESCRPLNVMYLSHCSCLK